MDPQPYGYCMQILQEDPNHFHLIEKPTYDMVMLALEGNPNNISEVDDPTIQMMGKVLDIHVKYIEQIPLRYRNKEICEYTYAKLCELSSFDFPIYYKMVMRAISFDFKEEDK